MEWYVVLSHAPVVLATAAGIAGMGPRYGVSAIWRGIWARDSVLVTIFLALNIGVLVFEASYSPPPAIAAHAALDAAIDNNNWAPTSVEIERQVVSAPNKTVRDISMEQYDQVHKREHDWFVGTVTTRAQAGKSTTVHYTLELIFMNGVTYHRSSLDHDRWHVQKGQRFKDKLANLTWARGRFVLNYLYDRPLKIVNRSATIIRLHAGQVHNEGSSVDIWVQELPQPQVVREDYRVTTKNAGATTYIHVSDEYSAFGKPVSIHPSI